MYMCVHVGANMFSYILRILCIKDCQHQHFVCCFMSEIVWLYTALLYTRTIIGGVAPASKM